MKSFKIFSIAACCFLFVTAASAQKTKTESFKVLGNCGMCKSKIEKAAKDAGAETAVWDVDTKLITVSYKTKSTNTAKIQEKIAGSGYDNVGAKASDDSYNKLHGCCKYDRTASMTSSDSHEALPDCCKDGKCTKEGHDGKDCCKKSDQ